MKRRHLLISLSTSACALAYGFHRQLAVAQLAQNSISLPLPPLDPNAARCPDGNGLFVLYYGAIANPPAQDESLKTIMSKQPNFVIFADSNEAKQRLRSDIPVYVHQNGGRAIMYVALGYGNNSSTDIDDKIDDAMKAGYDGIFFDEAAVSAEIHPWNAARAARVKSYETSRNKTTLVIFNPGIASPPQSIFNYADIVSVENFYNQKLPSYPDIWPWRWLAVQGDPAGEQSKTAPASAQEAIERTETFRKNGGFWYYSSALDVKNPLRPTHVDPIKPEGWYTTFADWVKSQPANPCPNFVNVIQCEKQGDALVNCKLQETNSP